MAEREKEDNAVSGPIPSAGNPPSIGAVGQTLLESDLHQIQKESEKQELPKQEKVFSIAKRVRSRLTHLPDPTHPPLGFVPGRGFDVVFPFIRLPELRPALNGDWVQFGSPELEPNRLYYGDNLQVLRTLPSESIDLIYIDPPFFSGEEYNVVWGDANEVRTFNDIWDGGLDTYLIWLNARLWEMRRILKSTGSIVVHCDWHAGHYIKGELDKIFGYDNFRNEIVWFYKGADNSRGNFPRKHDTLFWYAKTEAAMPKLDVVRVPYDEKEMIGKNIPKLREGRPGGFGKHAGTPLKIHPLGKVPEDVWHIPILRSHHEKIGYPTQKPEELLERIIKALTPDAGTSLLILTISLAAVR